MNRFAVLCLRPTRWAGVALAVALVLALGSDLHGQVGSRVTLNQDGVLVIDGQKVFPIGFTMPPPPDARAPNGRNAIEELRAAGATFLRTGVMGGPWDEAAARHVMHCWVFLRELGRRCTA